MNAKVSESTFITREEALKILNFEKEVNPTNQEIIDKYEDLFKKNDVKNKGSVYIQAKIYNAKEFLLKSQSTH